MNWRLPKTVYLALAIILFFGSDEIRAVNPDFGLQQYNLRSWRKDNGMPTSAANGLAIARDGRLWIASSKGLITFDGTEFKNISIEDVAFMRGKSMLAACSHAEGGIWFGLSDGGFGFYYRGEYQEVSQPDWLIKNTVQSVFESSTGELYVASTEGVVRRSKDGEYVNPLEDFEEDKLIDCYTVYEDSHGRIWYGTAEYGLFYEEAGVIHRFPDTSLRQVVIKSIAVDSKGNVWIASSRVLRCYDKNFKRVKLPHLGGGSNVVLVDSHDRIWVGTYDGIARFEGDHFSILNTSGGLSHNQVIAIVEGRDGSIWVGTADGLTQISDVKFPTYSATEGLASEGALCVAESPNGGLWIGTGNGASYMKNGEFHNLGLNGSDGVNSRWIKSIFVTKNGDAYLCGAKKNLDLCRDGQIIQTWEFDSWPRCLIDGPENLIVGLGNSLYQKQGEDWVPFLFEDGEAFNFQWINNLLLDRHGNVWVSSADGLYRIEDRKLVDVVKELGIPPGHYTGMMEGSNGALWVIQTKGLVRIMNGKYSLLTEEQGLFEPFIYAMVKDKQGDFWMDTNRGIYSVSEEELNQVADGEIEQVNCNVYVGSHVVKTNEKMVKYDYTGCCTNDGLVWFPSSKGVICVDPNNVTYLTQPPLVELNRVRVNGEYYNINEPRSLTPGPGNLEFEYGAVDYTAPEMIRYRYRLVGFDDNWIDAGSRRSAFYTNLPPGRYLFEVDACNPDGKWSRVSAQVGLVLPRRIYQTWPFRAAVLLAIIGLVIYLMWVWGLQKKQIVLKEQTSVMEDEVRVRTSELAKANLSLRLEVEQRKRAQNEAEHLGDQLRISVQEAEEAAQAKGRFLANMSHEIRTPMNGILGMTRLLLDTRLDPQQREFAETTFNSAESLLTILNDILDLSKIEAGKMVLEKVCFDLRDLVEESLELLSARASSKQVELVSEVDYRLQALWKADSGRLRQILLNLAGNAVKFTECGEVRIRVKPLSTGNTGLRFEIIDDGIGIENDVAKRLFQPFEQADSTTTRRYGGTGLGLAISKQIVEQMQGSIGVSSTPGEGSCFWFELPVESVEGASHINKRNWPVRDLEGKRLLVLGKKNMMRAALKHHCLAWGVELIIHGDEHDSLKDQAPGKETPCDGILATAELPFDKVQELTRSSCAAWNKEQCAVIFVGSNKQWFSISEQVPQNWYLLKRPIRELALLRCLYEAFGASVPEFLLENKDVSSDSSNTPANLLTIDGSSNSLKVLIVEDNHVNQRVASLLLKKMGLSSHPVYNGYEALDELARKKYDLVLMDCHMPELDGYETTRRLRNDDRYRDLYIIAMTANTLEGDREKCIECGMNDYVPKPIREGDIRAALNRVNDFIRQLRC